MTQKEKSIRYDEAIEIAKEINNEHKAQPFDVMLKVFPELAELEDEKIRKSLKDCFEWLRDDARWTDIYGSSFESVFTWLEKQGDANKEYWRGYKEGKQEILDKYAELEKQDEQKPTDNIKSKFKIGDWIVRGDTIAQILDIQEQYYIGIDTNGNDFTSSRFLSDDKIHLWTIQDAKAGDIIVTKNKNIFIFKSINGYTIYDYCGLYFKRFCDYSGTVNGSAAERLPVNYVPATKEQRDTLMKAMADAGYTFDFEKKKLKKIEQKSGENVEPKFKEGDWIVFNGLTLYVKKVVEGFYRTVSKGGITNSYDWDIDNVARLWTIQDAKDGDVLAFDNETMVIFKDLYNATTFHSYCHIEDGVFTASEKDVPDWWEGEGFQPATKEQRDLLFQKMKEVGYEWDAENKKLRKIEQKYTPKHKVGDTIYYNSFGKVKSMIVDNIVTDSTDNPMYEDKNGNAVFEKALIEQKPTDIDIDKMVDDYANNKERSNEEFGKPANCMIRAYRQGLIDAIGKVMLKLTWNEEDETKIKSIIAFLKSPSLCAMDENKGIIDANIKYIKSLKDRILPQPKQEWSEEDEKIYQSIIDDTVQENQLNSKQTNWLRDIKYRYFPQPKQEWSKEDEERIKNIISVLDVQVCWNGATGKKGNPYQREIDWLKSLKNRYTWKPSDKQMKLIEHICDGNYKVDLDILDSIYRDFKKLRGE